MAGCLIRGRCKWSVIYTSLQGLTKLEVRTLQKSKPYQLWHEKPYLLRSPARARTHNPKSPAQPDIITRKRVPPILVRPSGRNSYCFVRQTKRKYHYAIHYPGGYYLVQHHDNIHLNLRLQQLKWIYGSNVSSGTPWTITGGRFYYSEVVSRWYMSTF